jgi:hypothetical protein
MPDPKPKIKFSWRFLLAWALPFLALTIAGELQADSAVFLMFVLIPVLLLATLTLLVWGAFRRRQLWSALATCAILWLISICYLISRPTPFQLRETARWFLWSNEYKQQVLAHPSSPTGDLKHMEWDTSGFAGVGDNTAYLVFDPTDTLASSAGFYKVATFNGVRCRVWKIRRLESHWYAVLFYTAQSWEQCSLAPSP